jgi:site-specific DNA recombinase
MAPAQPKRVGREVKPLVDDHASGRHGPLEDRRAHSRYPNARLAHDICLTVHKVARDERVTTAYINILLRLRSLAPDIAAAIVNGQNPLEFNVKKLMRLTAHLPADWTEQRALLGFQ